MLRTLNERENYLWMIGQEHPFLIQCMLQLTGNIQETDVKKALHAMQQRHLLLQCTVSKTTSYTFYQNAKPLSFTHHLREDERSWEKIALDVINSPIPNTDISTFLTIDWVNDQNYHEFIFTIDHAFSDGASMVELIKTFLSDLDTIQKNHSIEITSYPDRENILNYLPENLKTIEKKASLTHLEAEHLGASKKETAACTPYFIQLSESESNAVFKAAKNKGVSVHGLLSTVLIHTLNDYLSHQDKLITTLIVSPMDTRKYLTGDIKPYELGNYASAVSHVFTVGQLPAAIETASDITQQIKQLYETSYIADLLKAFSEKAKDNAGEYQMLRMKDNTSTISNVGKIELPVHYHQFKFNTWRFSANSPYMVGRENFFWCIVFTINGRLQIDIVPPIPLKSTETLVRYGESFFKHLERLVGEFLG